MIWELKIEAKRQSFLAMNRRCACRMQECKLLRAEEPTPSSRQVLQALRARQSHRTLALWWDRMEARQHRNKALGHFCWMACLNPTSNNLRLIHLSQAANPAFIELWEVQDGCLALPSPFHKLNLKLSRPPEIPAMRAKSIGVWFWREMGLCWPVWNLVI